MHTCMCMHGKTTGTCFCLIIYVPVLLSYSWYTKCPQHLSQRTSLASIPAILNECLCSSWSCLLLGGRSSALPLDLWHHSGQTERVHLPSGPWRKSKQRRAASWLLIHFSAWEQECLTHQKSPFTPYLALSVSLPLSGLISVVNQLY